MSEQDNKFYLVYRQLSDLSDGPELSSEQVDELEAIDQIRRLVTEVSEEPPKFCTST